MNKGIEKMTKKIERWTDKKEGERMLVIGEDFNVRVRRKGGGFEEEEEESR